MGATIGFGLTVVVHLVADPSSVGRVGFLVGVGGDSAGRAGENCGW